MLVSHCLLAFAKNIKFWILHTHRFPNFGLFKQRRIREITSSGTIHYCARPVLYNHPRLWDDVLLLLRWPMCTLPFCASLVVKQVSKTHKSVHVSFFCHQYPPRVLFQFCCQQSVRDRVVLVAFFHVGNVQALNDGIDNGIPERGIAHCNYLSDCRVKLRKGLWWKAQEKREF